MVEYVVGLHVQEVSIIPVFNISSDFTNINTVSLNVMQ